MKKIKYRAAVIGLGFAGALIDAKLGPREFRKPYSHAAAYASLPDVELVAGANRGAERRREFTRRYGVKSVYEDWREMIAKERPDILSIATPTPTKTEMVLFAIEHGVRGIYCEKTLAVSLKEADRMAEALRKSGVAFNWGAERRHHDGYVRMRDAVAAGEIGEIRHVVVYTLSDLMKHGSHIFDLLAMLAGDPAPLWVEGKLVEPGSRLDPGDARPTPYTDLDLTAGRPLRLPTYDPATNRFVPPPGEEVGEPYMEHARALYANGVEAHYIATNGRRDWEVRGTEGVAFSFADETLMGIRRVKRRANAMTERTIVPQGDGPTVALIKDIISQMEGGPRTRGNIDVVMPIVEMQFGVAESHIKGGARIALPNTDRTLVVPSH